MEEVNEANKNEKKSRRIKLIKDKGTDFSMRILAFIVAVISWFIMSITQFPTINKTITGVHVDFSMNGTTAEEKGLAALNYKDITVDVEIKGMNYEIGTYTENDLIATVNLDDVTKEGTYSLDIDVKSSHSTDRCTVVAVSPSKVEVDFDRITQKTIEVTPEAPLITAHDGYTLKETSVSPKEITVEGPKNALDQISRVTARIAKSKKLGEDETIAADDIVFYDDDDKKLDTSKFTVKDSEAFNVNFVIYKKKQLDLKVNVTGAPDGFDTASLPLKLSQDNVSVITPHLDEPESEEVTLGNIALNSINLTKTFTFNIPLSTGEINTSGNDTVVVSFDGKGYKSATFTLDADNIELKSAPQSFVSEVDNARLPNVVLYGPEDVIDSLTDDDIHATVLLSDVKSTGSYTKEAKIYAEGQNKVWCFGTNEVQVTVSVPKTSDDSSEADSSAAE
ncbi:YbbR-like domain-containing protein [uncultured Ruminococcus sp.]|uniref:CdaR family protein n=1 Tax=uncultured Ruminococcus sp. TaxID=165186 RepID=UPI0025DD8855|nr:CdaR family protein [uncultured Ruminococcus sp.]